MSQTNVTIRPGGITAMAVMNFIIGSFQILGSMGGLACMGMAGSSGDGEWLATLGLNLSQLAGGILLIVSGAGLLGQKAVSGRIMGLVAALVILARGAARLVMMTGNGQALSLGDVTDIFYPLVILIFLGPVFHDLWSRKVRIHRDEAHPPAPWTLVFGHSFRQSIRSGSVFLVASVGIAAVLGMAQAVYIPLEFLSGTTLHDFLGTDVDPAGASLAFMKTISPFMAGLLGIGSPDEAFADFLLVHNPGFISLNVLVISFLVPFLAAVLGGSAISGDNQNRGLRFVLLRTGRTDIYLGKLASTWTLTALIVTFTVLMAFLYNFLRFPGIYDTTEQVLWTLRAWGSLMALTLPASALAVSFSALISTPAVSMMAVLGLLFVPGIFSLLSVRNAAMQFGELLLPQKMSFLLMHPDPVRVLIAGLAMAGYTAVYAWMGIAAFRARNL